MLIHISVFVSLYELRHTKIVNSIGASSENVGNKKNPLKDPQEQSHQVNVQIGHGCESIEIEHLTPAGRMKENLPEHLEPPPENGGHQKTESVTVKIGADS